ncbi:hypothetical protein ACFX19_009253 [Malus domestica]
MESGNTNLRFDRENDDATSVIQLDTEACKSRENGREREEGGGSDVVVFGEEMDSEGLEGLATTGVRAEGGDAIGRENPRSDDSSGDALSHFTCSDKP